MKLLLNKRCTSSIIFENANDFLKKIRKSNNILIICDSELKRYYKWLSEYKTFYIEASEKKKGFENISDVFDILYNEKVDASYYLTVIGGGSLTDKVGFAASVWYRGINLIYIPTTLLAMTDAAIGGKTGVNYNNVKNLIGTFYFPRYVIIDLNFINNLSPSSINDGIAEIIKHGFIKDASILRYLLRIHKIDNKTLLKKSIKVKVDIVKKDPFENNIRRLLNFGHTIGHAIETTYNLAHGLAVFNGMYYEMLVSQKLTGCPDGKAIEMLLKIGDKFNLKIIKPERQEEIIKKIYLDKKGFDSNFFIPVVKEIGKTEVMKVEKDKYIRTVKTIMKNGI